MQLYTNPTYQFRMNFPEGWQFVTPNRSSTICKARAPEGYAAATIASFGYLWAYDEDSITFRDAWAAYSNLTREVFEQRFERNDSAGNILPAIHWISLEMLGNEKALFVDYTLTDTEKAISIRIRAYLLLHAGRWFNVSFSTQPSAPDLFLEDWYESAKTFSFDS
jgi:hypothetical protein